MNLFEYSLLAVSSLFFIVDPIATVPAFLAMTSQDSAPQRLQMARLACWVMAGVLIVFALTGEGIFKLLGITLPAFQIAGSIVLLLIALDMLRAQRSRVQETREETMAGTAKEDIAITPLAVPMLAGPGAISTAVLLKNKAENPAQIGALCVCIVVVALLTYAIFRVSVRGARWLNPIAMKLTTRIMGLLLASVAIQFMLNALQEIRKTFH